MILNMAGAGGSALKVISAASAAALPTTAAEGTIAVITDTPITSFEIGFLVPAVPKEGMVYLSESNVSNVPVNVAKDPNIAYLYPTGCSQYVGDAWTIKDFRIRKNKEWVTPRTYLYNAGNQYTAVTGGWKARSGNGSIGKDRMTFSSGPNAGLPNDSSVMTVGKIDFTNFTKFHATLYSQSGDGCYTTIIDSGYSLGQTGGHLEYNIDITNLTGSYYVAIGGGSYYVCSGAVKEVWVE